MTALQALVDILGAENCFAEASSMQPYLTDWRGRFHGSALAVVFPHTAEQIRKILGVCLEHRLALTAQGGNTSMVGAATPLADGKNIVLNFAQMNNVLDVSAQDQSICVEAGATLQQVQNAAEENGLYFPLELSPKTQVQIGGAIATNAGGLNVLRYGMMRDLVLGIEAVMADGQIFQGLHKLKKNNAGYDIKQLLIGSEGTLGLVTKAVLRLYPKPTQKITVWAGFNTFKDCQDFFVNLRARFQPQLSAFEIMAQETVTLSLQHTGKPAPERFQPSGFHALFTLESMEQGDVALGQAENFLGKSNSQFFILAKDALHADKLWEIRKTIPLAEKALGHSIKHDISLPLSRWEDFLAEMPKKIGVEFPKSHIIAFGHLGDGNLHYNVSVTAAEGPKFLDTEQKINALVYGFVKSLGGSLSAEHGIGQARKGSFADFIPPENLDLMRQIKQQFDPDNILNPGKIFM